MHGAYAEIWTTLPPGLDGEGRSAPVPFLIGKITAIMNFSSVSTAAIAGVPGSMVELFQTKSVMGHTACSKI